MSLWLIKFFTSAIALGTIPDFVAQKLTRPSVNYRRCFYMGIGGGIMGAIMVEGFYMLMSHFFRQEQWLPRILWDQLCFSPTSNAFIMVCVFYFNRWLNKDLSSSAWDYLKNNYVRLQLSSNLYWTPAALSIYIYLPDQYKLFGQNAYALVWGVVMSILLHRKQKLSPPAPSSFAASA